MLLEGLRDSRGFTFLELIAALLVVSIVSAVLLSRATSVESFQVREESDRLKIHLRYAQRRALKTNSTWGIHFGSSTGYWLFKGDVSNRKTLPDEASSEMTLKSLQVTASPLTVTFDAYGSPGKVAVNIPTSNGVIIVQADTGFVQ